MTNYCTHHHGACSSTSGSMKEYQITLQITHSSVRRIFPSRRESCLSVHRGCPRYETTVIAEPTVLQRYLGEHSLSAQTDSSVFGQGIQLVEIQPSFVMECVIENKNVGSGHRNATAVHYDERSVQPFSIHQ